MALLWWLGSDWVVMICDDVCQSCPTLTDWLSCWKMQGCRDRRNSYRIYSTMVGPPPPGYNLSCLDPTKQLNELFAAMAAMAQGDDFKLQSLWPLSRSHDWSCCLAWVLDEDFLYHGAHQAISSWLHASFFLIWPFTPVWEVSSSVFREISRVSSCSRKQLYLWRVLTSL